MSMYVSTKLIGIIAFIMIFTYFAEGIIFLDATAYDQSIETNPISNILSFEQWLNIQWDFAYDDVYHTTTYHTMYGGTPQINNPDKSGAITGDCWNHCIGTECRGLLVEYPTPDFGYKLYAMGHDTCASDRMSLKLYYELEDGYDLYLRNLGYTDDDGVLKPYQKNMLETAMDFLGNIPKFFGGVIDLITFNIKQTYTNTVGEVVTVNVIPDNVMYMLNLIFTPMWIILAIEVLPLISKIIEAIGSLIPF